MGATSLTRKVARMARSNSATAARHNQAPAHGYESENRNAVSTFPRL